MTNHRDDDWDPTHLRRVRFFYGLVAGGVMTLAGVLVMVYDVMTEGADWRILAFGAGLVLVGGVAALPNQFMPILSAILKKVPGRGGEVVQAEDPPHTVQGGAQEPPASSGSPKRPPKRNSR